MIITNSYEFQFNQLRRTKMKKIFVITLLLIITSATISHAQRAKFVRGVGLKFGATFTSQEWNYSVFSAENYNPDSRTGLNAGVFAEFLDVPLLSIVTELNYVQKGVEATTDIPIINLNARLDYINITALAKLRFDLGLVKPYVVLGPKVDFEISRNDFLDEVDLKKNRLGLKVGAGAEFDLQVITLLAEIIYDADFNELYDNQNLKINTNSFDLRVGIMF